MIENKLKCKKIKDKEKESKSDFFLLGCLPVSAFVLCHWLDMWHAYSS